MAVALVERQSAGFRVRIYSQTMKRI